VFTEPLESVTEGPGTPLAGATATGTTGAHAAPAETPRTDLPATATAALCGNYVFFPHSVILSQEKDVEEIHQAIL